MSQSPCLICWTLSVARRLPAAWADVNRPWSVGAAFSHIRQETQNPQDPLFIPQSGENATVAADQLALDDDRWHLCLEGGSGRRLPARAFREEDFVPDLDPAQDPVFRLRDKVGAQPLDAGKWLLRAPRAKALGHGAIRDGSILHPLGPQPKNGRVRWTDRRASSCTRRTGRPSLGVRRSARTRASAGVCRSPGRRLGVARSSSRRSKSTSLMSGQGRPRSTCGSTSAAGPSGRSCGNGCSVWCVVAARGESLRGCSWRRRLCGGSRVEIGRAHV